MSCSSGLASAPGARRFGLRGVLDGGSAGLPGRTRDCGPAVTLPRLADAADPAAVPLVLAASRLDINPLALLDLLDRPGVRTAADRGAPRGHRPRPRPTSASRAWAATVAHVESAGTAAHAVSAPTHALLGVLRVAPGDRAQAARLWRDAAAAATDASAAGRRRVAAPRPGARWGERRRRPARPVQFPRAMRRPGRGRRSPGSQRLRGASRGGDGFFSTYAVRPLSRRLTGSGSATSWTPQRVTVACLADRVLAALASSPRRLPLGLGRRRRPAAWPSWSTASTARSPGSPAGSARSAPGSTPWATGSRSTRLLAAVAVVAVRRGEPPWVARDRSRWCSSRSGTSRTTPTSTAAASPARTSRPTCSPSTRPATSVPGGRSTDVPAPAPRVAEAVFLDQEGAPPADRRALPALSLGLLTRHPMWCCGRSPVAVGIALVWTQGGRTAKAVLGLGRLPP